MSLLLRITFWAAAAFAFAMAVLPHPPQLPGSPGDKFQHILAFVTLAGLGMAAYPRMSPIRLALALFAFGALIEVVQMVPALNRDADVLDWTADAMAVVITLIVVKALRWKFTRIRA